MEEGSTNLLPLLFNAIVYETPLFLCSIFLEFWLVNFLPSEAQDRRGVEYLSFVLFVNINEFLRLAF